MLKLTDRTVDLATGIVEGGSGLTLTDRERALLAYLAARPCEAISRDELLEQVWGYSKRVISRAADNAVRRLREKIEADPSRPRHLIGVFGVGYQFVPAEAEAEAPAPPPAVKRRRLCFSDRTIDLDRAVAQGPGGEVSLTALEVEVLSALAARPGVVVERSALIRAVWKDATRPGAVGSVMHRLRCKLEVDPADPRHLLTIRGVGYRLRLDAPGGTGRAPRTLVHVGIVPLREAWDEVESDATASIAPLVRWIAQAAAEGGGIGVGAGWRFAFPDPGAAIGFADAVQRSAPLDPTSGLALRIGVHHGRPLVWADPSTGQPSVVGPETHRVVDLLRRAPAGAIVVDEGAWEVAGAQSGLQGVAIGYGAIQIGGQQVAATAPSSLPWIGDRYVGRQALFQEVHALIEGGARLVSLVGAAGVGKSRLALELCTRSARSGIVHVPIGDVRGLPAFLGAVCGALGVPPAGGGAVDRLHDALSRRGPTLLWLDDLDSAGDEAIAAIAAWIRSFDSVSVLATARRALDLPGERAVAVEPFDDDDAFALFVERSVRSDFDPAAVRTLVRELDGLPLAIELAAARTASHSVEQLLQRLPQRLRLLQRRDGTARHRSMAAALDVSWDLLGPHERTALARCAVFCGGFDLAAAEAVLDDGTDGDAPWAPDLVEALVRHHLVRVVGPRYALPDSVAAYAADRLAGDPAAERAAQIAHGRAYARLGEPDDLDALRAHAVTPTSAAAEAANLEAACKRAVQRGDADIAAPTALALAVIRSRIGPYDAGIAALRAAAPLGGSREIEIQIALGKMLDLAADPSADATLEDALGAARAAGNRRLEARAALTLADAREGRPVADRLADLRRIRSLARRAGDLRTEASATISAGTIALPSDDPHATLLEGLQMALRIGDRWLELRALLSLGRLEHNRGRFAACEERYADALSLARELGDRRGEAVGLGGLSNAVRLSDPARAATCLRAALLLFRRIGDIRGEVVALSNLGVLEVDRDDDDAALRSYRQALTLAVRIDDPLVQTNCRAALGVLYAKKRRWTEAKEVLEAAYETATRLGYPVLATNIVVSLCRLPDADDRLLDRIAAVAPAAAEGPLAQYVQLLIRKALILDAYGDDPEAVASVLQAIERRAAALDDRVGTSVYDDLDELRDRLGKITPLRRADAS